MSLFQASEALQVHKPSSHPAVKPVRALSVDNALQCETLPT